MKKIGIFAAVLIVAGLIAVMLKPSYSAAPEFSLTDLNGTTVNQDALKNRVSLVNFWFPS